MGSKIPPNKALQDIEDCVSEFKRTSLNGRKAINDDSSTLHRFQEKLESVLLFGLLEKPGLLGLKKSYWNYICACFASSKRSHDGINYVKSVVQLKSSLGRGRAFIRFCLSQKCLADTLQSCFMDQKVSRDFYVERSLPTQEKLWSALVTSLYELNEFNFDLSAGHTELDISWPKFARKHFTSLDTENFPYKNMSAPNLQSFSLQAECDTAKYFDSHSLSAFDACTSSSSSAVENLDACTISELTEELSEQNKSLQKQVKYLEEERLRLQMDIQNLQTEYQFLQEKMSCTCKDDPNKAKVNLEDKDVQTSPISIFEKLDAGSLEKLNDDRTTMNVVDTDNSTSISSSEKPSVKSNIKSEARENSECALQQNDNDMVTVKLSDSSDIDYRTSENLYVNRSLYLPQNHVYISEHLLQIKTVIDDIEDIVQKSDITLAVPHISRLKRIRSSLEEKLLNEFDKSKNCANFSQFVENCVSNLKNFFSKQENIINSLQEKVDLSVNKNQNLYTRIFVLKDLLRSYGFLKLSHEVGSETKTILPLDVGPVTSESYDDFVCDNLAHDPVLKRIIVPLLPIFNSTFSKLSNLNGKVIELQFGIESSQELNNNLISRVQDQVMHLKGVTKELEEAQHLVSVLKKQHRKLQSAEGIVKYDLQEKRKLLTRLRQQLENTREDFNLVRIKNSKSEAEWKDLRKEFVQRHKQTSEESGFIDDKGFEEHETVFSNSNCDSNFSEGSTESVSESNNSAEVPYQDVPAKKSRLELLEEQCQHLYSSLLESSKRRQDIDRRLETMCRTIEKSHTGIVHSGAFSADIPSENVCQNTNVTSVHSSSEDICQNVVFSSDNFINSPHSSSDVGSLNSECSSYMPGICNDANSSDSCYCESSKTDSSISFSPCKLQVGSMQTSCINEQINEANSLHDSDSVSACNSKFKAVDEIIDVSSESGELAENDIQNSHLEEVPLSHVDSLLIKKKDLEESIKNLEINNGLSSDKNRYLDSEEFAKQISTLEDEKRLLLSKIQELERKTLVISTELDQTTQQLILSKAAKEHEVAALQFQLNTEALKYERALKEFSEQSKGLESMKQKITEQEHLILTLEEALTEIRTDRENEKELQWQELEDIHIALEAREQECITLCQDLEKSMSDIEKERDKNEILQSQLEELKTYNVKDRESMEAELIHLQSDSKELQKRLIKLLKEKDILWKKNNHLYHLQRTKTDYRWMNDSEVSSCMGCKITFSFMLRKHHCRICGRIFCYSCSNNWLLTASSRKKIRSCNECFMQYMEMKRDIKRGGEVPQIEDDSEDESHDGVLPFISRNSRSFTSDVPSSITDSIISLPITQKQSTPLFASAPDLRYVITTDEVSSSSKPLLDRNVFEESEEKVLVNDDKKNLELDTDISSDECTSITLEDESANIIRLKDITVDEIKDLEHGLNGEFVIHSGEKADLPIFCRICPVTLKWSFASSCQSIPITITYTDETCDNESTVFYQDKHKMEDEMRISFPGCYTFHFDNTFRVSDTKIEYVLLTKFASQTEDSVHEEKEFL